MTFYIAVTQDKYELPVAVAETASELARMMGTTSGAVHSNLSKVRRGKIKKVRFEKVEVEEDENVERDYSNHPERNKKNKPPSKEISANLERTIRNGHVCTCACIAAPRALSGRTRQKAAHQKEKPTPVKKTENRVNNNDISRTVSAKRH